MNDGSQLQRARPGFPQTGRAEAAANLGPAKAGPEFGRDANAEVEDAPVLHEVAGC